MGNIKAMTGNTTAAIAASLCRPDLVAAYPITPQSSVAEYLSELVHDGILDANLVTTESEHSVMSVIQGAACAGARTFTATSAQGLAFMYEPYFQMSTMRLPMVMALVTREMISPCTVWSGQQDAMSVRDAGWIQVYVENNQEIMDMIIQSYMISEDDDVLIPVNVCYDGFYLSHLVEGVDIPTQKEVDAFLPPVHFDHAILDPDFPMAVDSLTSGEVLMRYRKTHLEAMEKALDVIEEVDKNFQAAFGRSYGGAIETYKCDDADIILITIGGMTGTARDAVDMSRENGIRVGLLKLRFVRPFPARQIAQVLSGKKGFAVVDRSVCFGWSTGPMYMEVRASAINESSDYCHFSAIGGLGGADISLKHMLSIIEKLEKEKNQVGQTDTLWLTKEL